MSESELLNELKGLQSQEGTLEEPLLLKKKQLIYKQLLESSPDHPSYKLGLAETLMRQGTNEKLVYLNYNEAKRIFLEILDLNPDHAVALYRLGHVQLELQQWHQAMEIFQRTVELDLSNIKKVRVYCGLAEAAYYLNYANESLNYLNEASRFDTERDCTNDLDRMKKMIANPNNKYIVTVDNESFFSDDEEYDDVNEADGREYNIILLDLTSNHAKLIHPNSEVPVKITPKQYKLLKYLSDHKKHFKMTANIHDRLWEDEEGLDPEIISNRVKNVVCELRSRLKELNLEVPVNELIENHRYKGWRWNGPYKLKLLVRNFYGYYL